jgi:hypothetical protein
MQNGIRLFLGLICASGAVVASAACLYDNKEYQPFEQIVFVDHLYYGFDADLGTSPQLAGYSSDGYAIGLICGPIADIALITEKKFNTNEIPVNSAEWIVNPMFFVKEDLVFVPLEGKM